LTEQIEEAGGKWKCSHSSMNDGRRATVVLIRVDGKYYQGIAQCSEKEPMFLKWMGRKIAMGRAVGNMLKDRALPESALTEWHKKGY